MTYQSMVEMGSSQSLIARVAACAAEQGNSQARTWAGNNILMIASRAAFDWDASWDAGRAALTVNDQPDLGVRTDVITDAQILTAVQTLKSEQATTQGWP